MPLDRAVAKTVWDGKVPVVLLLSPSDMASFKQPDPLYFLLPRCSFFPLHIDERIRQHFAEFAAKGADADELWLESNDAPLKWHTPVGVLFDLHVRQTHLPWTVYVHLRNFPADRLVRLGGDEAVQNHFFSMVKQTDYIKNGSTKKIVSLTKNDQLQLWDGFKTQQFDRFWAVNSQLISDGVTSFKALPVRVYLDGGSVIQDVIPPQTLTNRLTQLLDVLRRCVPTLFPTPPGTPPVFPAPVVKKAAAAAEGDNDDGGDASSTKGADGETTSAGTPASAAADAPTPVQVAPSLMPTPPQAAAAAGGTGLDLAEAYIHGVKPAMDTPLVWLCDNMCHPDNFLHIVVRRLDPPAR